MPPLFELRYATAAAAHAGDDEGAVRTVFELFEQEGTAYAVVRRFQELGLRFPRRSYGGAWDGKLLWGRLTHSCMIGLLANPSYAGAYVFGR